MADKIQVKFDATKSLEAAQAASALSANKGTVYFSQSDVITERKIIVDGKDYTGYIKPATGIPASDLAGSIPTSKIEQIGYNDLNADLQTQVMRGEVAYKLFYNVDPNVPAAFTITSTGNASIPNTATAPSGDSSTRVATTAYVQNAIAGTVGGMIFKGTCSSTYPLPTTGYKAGWTYVVAEAGTYVGQTCEVGDMVIAIRDYVQQSASNADWNVIQVNTNGAVTGPASATNGNIALFDGSTGKIIKDSLVTLPANPKFTDTWRDIEVNDVSIGDNSLGIFSEGHIRLSLNNIGDLTISDNITNASTSADGLMSAADKVKLNGIETGAEKHKAPTASEIKDALGVVDQSGNDVYSFTKDGHWTYNNYAGANDTSSKIYLIGAVTQGDARWTYSHDTCYVGTDGCLYSNGEKVATESSAKIYWESE